MKYLYFIIDTIGGHSWGTNDEETAMSYVGHDGYFVLCTKSMKRITL